MSSEEEQNSQYDFYGNLRESVPEASSYESEEIIKISVQRSKGQRSSRTNNRYENFGELIDNDDEENHDQTCILNPSF